MCNVIFNIVILSFHAGSKKDQYAFFIVHIGQCLFTVCKLFGWTDIVFDKKEQEKILKKWIIHS